LKAGKRDAAPSVVSATEGGIAAGRDIRDNTFNIGVNANEIEHRIAAAQRPLTERIEALTDGSLNIREEIRSKVNAFAHSNEFKVMNDQPDKSDPARRRAIGASCAVLFVPCLATALAYFIWFPALHGVWWLLALIFFRPSSRVWSCIMRALFNSEFLEYEA
jgi:hypothetical protein